MKFPITVGLHIFFAAVPAAREIARNHHKVCARGKGKSCSPFPASLRGCQALEEPVKVSKTGDRRPTYPITSEELSHEECYTICYESSSTVYFGMNGGNTCQCFDDWTPSAGPPVCDSICSGNDTEICGGSDPTSWTVYIMWAWTEGVEEKLCGTPPAVPHAKRMCENGGGEYGPTCEVQCDFGYQLASNSLLCDTVRGKWLGTAECSEVKCTLPPQVQHSASVCKSASAWNNETCEVTCLPGYELSENTLVCRSTGWNRTDGGFFEGAAVCSPVSCGEPPSMPLASSVKMEIVYPTIVTYYCKHGSTVDGALDGKLNYEVQCETTAEFTDTEERCVPVPCEAPPELNHTRRIDAHGNDDWVYPMKAEYQCDQGMSIDGTANSPRTFEISCTIAGNYTLPSTCLPITCGPAVNLSHCKANLGDPARYFYYLETVDYQCDPGYTLNVNDITQREFATVCKDDGLFHDVQHCQPVSCGMPPVVAHASTPLVEVLFPNTAHFQCEEGYTTTGSAFGPDYFVLDCLTDAQFGMQAQLQSELVAYWEYGSCGPFGNDHNVQICGGLTSQKPTKCPSQIDVAESVCPSRKAVLESVQGDGVNNGRGVGSVYIDNCEYLYFARYRCAGASPEGSCLPINCGSVPEFPKASPDRGAAVYPEVVEYTCEPGYSIDRTAVPGAGVFSIQCMSHGQFSMGHPCLNIDDCAGHTCGPFGHCVDHLMNYTCECESGYAPYKNKDGELLCGNIDDCGPMACGAGGSCKDLVNDYTCECFEGHEMIEMGDEKVCTRVECGNPPPVDNAEAPPHKAAYQDLVEYTCMDGYTTDGIADGPAGFAIECLATASFAEPQECKPVVCGSPPPVDHSTVSSSGGDLHFPDAASYVCETGYTTDGIAGGPMGFTVSCLATGRISAHQVCLPVSCGPPQPVSKATVTPADDTLTFGHVAAYVCNEGHATDPATPSAREFSATCNAAGEFDGLMSCQPVFCVLPRMGTTAAVRIAVPEEEPAFRHGEAQAACAQFAKMTNLRTIEKTCSDVGTERKCKKSYLWMESDGIVKPCKYTDGTCVLDTDIGDWVYECVDPSGAAPTVEAPREETCTVTFFYHNFDGTDDRDIERTFTAFFLRRPLVYNVQFFDDGGSNSEEGPHSYRDSTLIFVDAEGTEHRVTLVDNSHAAHNIMDVRFSENCPMEPSEEEWDRQKAATTTTTTPVPVTWARSATRQCTVTEEETSEPGDVMANPLFGHSAEPVTLDECKAGCMTAHDNYGRPCVGIEWSDGGEKLDIAEKRDCAYAWGCSRMTPWSGGSVYRLIQADEQPDLVAYWEYGACGPFGNDHNVRLCGGTTSQMPTKCPSQILVSASVCPSRNAILESVQGDGVNNGHGVGSVYIDDCEYLYFAQYKCSTASTEATYQKYTGMQCTGSESDILRNFQGTAEECKARCSDLAGCRGFIRVNSGSSKEGKCFFRGGTVSTPETHRGDDRDCYLPTGHYDKFFGSQCIGSSADVERDFVGTAEECMERCAELSECTGFVRVNSGSEQHSGKCFFRGGTISAPVRFTRDNRDCYIPKVVLEGRYRILAEAPNGNRGPLAVWGLQNGDDNGRYVRWYNGEYTSCAYPGCDFFISSLGNGKYKIEAEAANGNRGPLAVWGLQDGDDNGRYVRWYNGDYSSCIYPGCDFYISSLGAGKFKIEAEALNGNRGPLAVWGLQDGDDNGRYLRWYNGEYSSCASPGCDFYIVQTPTCPRGEPEWAASDSVGGCYIEAPKCGKSPGSNIGGAHSAHSISEVHAACLSNPECEAILYRASKGKYYLLPRKYDDEYSTSGDDAMVANKVCQTTTTTTTGSCPGAEPNLPPSAIVGGCFIEAPRCGRSPGSNLGGALSGTLEEANEACLSVANCEAILYRASTGKYAILDRKYNTNYETATDDCIVADKFCQAEEDLVKLEANQNDCPNGYGYIMDIDACKAALSTLGYPYDSFYQNSPREDRPTGCLWHQNGKGYFNPAGKTVFSDQAPVCKKAHLHSDLQFALKAEESSPTSLLDPITGMALGAKPITTHAGHVCWNLDNDYLEYESGNKPAFGQVYTHAAWVYWRDSDAGWRTLIRPSSDHSVLIQDGAKDLGMYSNRDGRFRDSGYDIDNDMSSWQLVIVIGKGTSPTASGGTSTFYTAAEGETEMVMRGTADRVVSGTEFFRFGWPGQGPGKVAAAYGWSRALSAMEMNSLLTHGASGGLEKAVEPNLAILALNDNDCPTGYAHIMDIDSCKAALSTLEFPYNAYYQTSPREDRPTGCIWHNNGKGYFNPSGKTAFSDQAPICEKAPIRYSKVHDCSPGYFTGVAYTESQTPTIEDCAHICQEKANCEYFTYGNQEGFVGIVSGQSYTSDGHRANDCIMVENGNYRSGHESKCRWNVYKLEPQALLHSELQFAITAMGSSSTSLSDSTTGMALGAKPVTTHAGHACWNLDNTYLEYKSGYKPKFGQVYTHAVWVYWRDSDTGWRTLLRPSTDHSVLIQDGAKDLGMYSNRNGQFRDSGYDIVNDMSSWQLVVVIGEGDSATANTGTSTFYTAPEGATEMVMRGTADRVVSGTDFFRLGWPGQGPGKVAAAYGWTRALSTTEMNLLLTNGVSGDLKAAASLIATGRRVQEVTPPTAQMCVEGSARAADFEVPVAGQAFYPEVLHDGDWYPVCGHYFWDDNNAATTLCKMLGFLEGQHADTRTTFAIDAMPIGKCNPGQPLTACTAGGNAWGDFSYRDAWCIAGKNIGVTVTCTGGSYSGGCQHEDNQAAKTPTVQRCVEGSARAADVDVPVAGQAFYPEVLHGGDWYPVCGHSFWDDINAATTLCKMLGFLEGQYADTRTTFATDAMPIGKCNPGQPLTACTAGGNAWGDFSYRDGWCRAGKNIGVTVTCTGGAYSGGCQEDSTQAATVSPEERVTYLTEVVFTCETGYTTTGEANGISSITSRCTAEGALSLVDMDPAEPQCQKVKCGAPPQVADASITDKPDDVAYLDKVAYKCERGWAVSHEMTSTGLFTPTGGTSPITTFEIECLETGLYSPVSLCLNIDDCVGHTCGAHGTCKDGVQDYTCQCEDGFEQNTLADGEKICGNIDDCGPNACGAHGTCVDLVNDYACECEAGYEVIVNDGEKTCEPRPCPRINAVAGSSLKDGVSLVYPNTVKVWCNRGHSIDGTALPDATTFVVSCQEDGSLTAVHSCLKVECGLAPSVSNADADPSNPSEYRYGDKAKYNCHEGYTFSGHATGEVSLELTCGHDGTFPPVSSHCLPVVCGAPPPIKHAISTATKVVFGASATWQCESGYALRADRPNSNTVERRCLASGAFEPVPAQYTEDIEIACSAQKCEELGWTDQAFLGDGNFMGGLGVPGVCAGVDQCPGELTYEEAKDFCETKGARLCLEEELFNYEKGNGCFTDLAYTWTSTPCSEGVMTVKVTANGAAPHPLSECTPTTAQAARTSPTPPSTPDRYHQECWGAGGCRDDGANVCGWCGMHEGQEMHCCRKDWISRYGEGHNCRNVNSGRAGSHRCVTQAPTPAPKMLSGQCCADVGSFCQNDKRRVPSVAECVKISCGEPPAAEKATRDVPTGQTLSFGDVAHYQCEDGTTIDGTSVGLKEWSIACEASGSFSQPLATACQTVAFQVQGHITDATNLDPVSGATVKLTCVGGLTVSETTTGTGHFTATGIPEGEADIEVSKAGSFITTSKRVTVTRNIINGGLADFSISPVLPPTGWRIVLRWLEDPADLDSHLYFGNGQGCHVYYGTKHLNCNGMMASLDVDDTNGKGPETITINNVCDHPTQCQIWYKVKKYSGRGGMKAGDATVKVYNGDNEVATYSAAADDGIIRRGWWSVLRIDGASASVTKCTDFNCGR